jgi:hypothetical protein
MPRKFRLGNLRAAKLTPEEVVEIRERYWQDGETQSSLCHKYGVTIGTIGRVVRGETFQDYGGPVPYSREKPAAQRLAEAGEDRALMSNAPKPDDAAIAASIAKTIQFIEKPPDRQIGGEPAPDGAKPAGETPALAGDNK